MTKYNYFDVEGKDVNVSFTLTEMIDTNTETSSFELTVVEGSNPFVESEIQDIFEEMIVNLDDENGEINIFINEVPYTITYDLNN